MSATDQKLRLHELAARLERLAEDVAITVNNLGPIPGEPPQIAWIDAIEAGTDAVDRALNDPERIAELLGATPDAETPVSHIERIERQLDATRNALRFYADETNWSLSRDMDSMSAVEEDHGTQARNALETD